MRTRFDKDAINIINQSPYFIAKYPIQLSNNDILEIGMGKGYMLSEMALLYPNLKFYGLEKDVTIASKSIKRFASKELKNINLILDDVKNLPEIFIGKLNTIWLTFSDPWPKKKHAKRRLTHSNYLNLYKQILSEEGILKLKTDNDALFEYTIEEVQQFGAQIIFMTKDLHNSIKNKDNIQTEYEVKWSQKGKNINYLEVKF